MGWGETGDRGESGLFSLGKEACHRGSWWKDSERTSAAFFKLCFVFFFPQKCNLVSPALNALLFVVVFFIEMRNWL